MPSPLLTTKLFIPIIRPGIVARPELVHKLDAGMKRKLILVSAPAGYGKTTLLAEWIDQQSLRIGWVSLDAQDNDLKRFFSYIIASLRTIDIPIHENTLVSLKDPIPESVSGFLSQLINQISDSPESVYLVLDDYHRITNPAIHQSLSFLLKNLPQNMHLIIATRSDPLLQLAKLRAQGELCEIRVDDLRFTIEETVQYLNQRMRLGLSQSDITTLTKKTEGWIVGLQLASISLQRDPDKHQFVLSFAGDNRYIADYLFDEAFNRQQGEIQSFLLRTSVFERFNAQLCDAVTGQDNSQTILAELERANLFLVPLDSQRNWYRYHHLFGELLYNRLQRSNPESILTLNQQASIWFEEHNLLADSIKHALAANDTERIAQLAEGMAIHKMDAEELVTLLTWINRQPENILREYPWLLLARTWADINTGKYDRAETGFSEIEDILSSQIYPDKLAIRIRGHLAAIRSYLAEHRSEGPETMIQFAEDALELLNERDILLRSFVAIRWAIGLSLQGEYSRAIQALYETGNTCKLAGEGQLAVNAFSEMAEVQILIGKLNQAHIDMLEVKDYAEMLAQADGRWLPSMGLLYRDLSNIKYELNELEEAEKYARQSVEICKQCGENEALFLSLCLLGKIKFGKREYDKFEIFFDQGLQIANKILPEDYLPLKHIKNHYLLLQGKIEETEEIAHECGLKISDQFNLRRRLEYQNFARLLAAKGEYEQALQVVNNVLEVIEQVGAKGYFLRAKILQAKIFHWLNQPLEAQKALEESLALASQEGYVRAYIDEGEVVAKMLYQAAQKGIYPDYCKKLLNDFPEEIPAKLDHLESSRSVVEPLSPREMDVLLFISRGYSNKEIAKELIVSLSTVKSHARNIFGKLGVKNRTEAVAKARMFGLLPED